MKGGEKNRKISSTLWKHEPFHKIDFVNTLFSSETTTEETVEIQPIL